MSETLGRPSSFTQEVADVICDRLADGESLRSICVDDAMPDKKTVFRWLQDKDRDDFRHQYACARELQADTHVDEMADIADDGTNDYITKTRPDGSTYEAFDAEHVQRSRLRIDTRKWIAERMRPKKYGAKVALTDPDGGPLTVQVLKLSDAPADADNSAST